MCAGECTHMRVAPRVRTETDHKTRNNTQPVGVSRCWLGRWSRAELKRRREQRARDALLAPALAPSKRPALHERLSPCPPRTDRRAGAGPSGFRKRLISGGGGGRVVTPCSQDVDSEHARAPLRVCKVKASPGGVGDANGGGGGARDDEEDKEARERRLLQEQQERISAEIVRASARAPKNAFVFPHEVVQGGSGAALLALRKLGSG